MENLEPKKYPQRTLPQNAAIHLLFNLLAEELNNAGLDVNTVLRKDIAVSWSPFLVKELIWKRVQKSYLGKKSTTQLKTNEIDPIFDIINRYLGEKFGVHCDFPSIETIMYKQSDYAPTNTKNKNSN